MSAVEENAIPQSPTHAYSLIQVNDDSVGVRELPITNNLTSTDVNGVLSAYQGKVLNDSKAPKVSPVFSGVHLNIRYLQGGDILITDDVVYGSDNISAPVVLPKASTCKGKVITTICYADELPYTVNSFSGDLIVVNNAAGLVTTTNIPYPYNSKTFISDGINFWYQI